MNAESRLESLAGSVSDDAPVDWTPEGVVADDDDARIAALQDVARIAAFSRSLQRTAITADEVRSLEPSRWGELLLLEAVGSGRNGEVWRAWDPRLQREVALKLLRAAAPGASAATEASPLLAEARTLASVRHANVVAVHGLAEHDGRGGVWMEYLHGATLADEIERHGALPVETVRDLARQLAQALAAIHGAGLVHRDVKPANVVLEPGGRVVLADLGLGTRREKAEAEPAALSGTPLFLAPERLAGGPADRATDLYALGVLLWWALAGAPPFASRSLAELEHEAARGPSRRLADVRPDAPIELTSAIEQAMAPDPSRRLASGEALLAALAAEPARRSRSRAPWPAALAAVVAIALVAWALLARDRTPRDTRATIEPQATAAPAAPAVAVEAPYDVGATLVRRNTGGYERLAPGDRVAPGDRLSLEFHASRPAYVYVVSEDERGESYLLYPQPLFDVANPVPADSTVVLPGTMGGRESAWTVTSRGGREHFLVVASVEPVPEIEAALSRMPAARPGRPVAYAAIEPATVERLRGVGGVTALPRDDGPRRVGAVARIATLAGREKGVTGVWVREVTLENPLR